MSVGQEIEIGGYEAEKTTVIEGSDHAFFTFKCGIWTTNQEQWPRRSTDAAPALCFLVSTAHFRAKFLSHEIHDEGIRGILFASKKPVVAVAWITGLTAMWCAFDIGCGLHREQG